MFDCGGSAPYEREVNDIARAFYANGAAGLEVRVAESNDVGDLAGVCAIGPRALHPVGPVLGDGRAAYIAVIGVQSTYRGRRLPDGRRIGELLLGDALNQIFQAWGAPPMPTVWALVASANDASHRLFAGFGFGRILGPTYDIRLRPAGIGLRPSQ